MKINSLVKELEVLATGWEKYALDQKFSGYTLEQLKALIVALKELMAAMGALKLDYRKGHQGRIQRKVQSVDEKVKALQSGGDAG